MGIPYPAHPRSDAVTEQPRLILRNRIRCRRCGDIIESKHAQDFQTCRCGAVSVDGGQDHLRRLGRREDRDELSEFGPVH